MSSWAETIARRLRALQLGSMRNEILAFALLATMIPTLATTLVFSCRNQQSLSDAAAQELRGARSEAAREIDLGLNQRLDALRGAASSYVVAENLAKLRGRQGAQALGRLRDYLNSVRERLPDHEGLLVIDREGRVVTGSSGRVGGVRLPPDGLKNLRTAGALVGDAYWDAALGRAAIILAVPIRQVDGLFLGAFTAKLNLHAIADLLHRLSPDDPGDLYLVTDQGRAVSRSRGRSAALMRTKLPDKTIAALFEREGQSVEVKRANGQEGVGALRRVPQLRWAAVAELPQAEAFRRARRPRNATACLTLALLAAVVR